MLVVQALVHAHMKGGAVVNSKAVVEGVLGLLKTCVRATADSTGKQEEGMLKHHMSAVTSPGTDWQG